MLFNPAFQMKCKNKELNVVFTVRSRWSRTLQTSKQLWKLVWADKLNDAELKYVN